MKLLTKKTIVIVGPTASGKSDLAIALARRYDGEIISADSRQVYRGMDIGSGKVTRDSVTSHPEPVEGPRKKMAKLYISEGIRHWLLDVASPKRIYNVTHFVRDAKKALIDIRKRGKVPIICGGTGFWVQALIENNTFPAVKPDGALRKKLTKKSTVELFTILQKKDPARAKTIDPHNKIRLIRALEICATLGTVPLSHQSSFINYQDFCIIALVPNPEVLKKNIDVRLKKRLKQGMIAEVRRLRTAGISWKKLESFGLEYKNAALLLQGKIIHKEMEELLKYEIWHYAKRQLTWLRRFEKMGAKFHWMSDPTKALKIIEKDI